MMSMPGLLVGILACTRLVTADTDYEACRTTDIMTGGVGHSGTISSPVRGADRDDSCEMVLNTCPECRLQITVLEEDFKECSHDFQHGYQYGCVQPCQDYIAVHEPYYQDTAYQYIGPGSSGAGLTYTSITSKLFLNICLKSGLASFKLSYNVTRKEEVMTGRNGDTFTFTSPRFPHGYHPTGDVYRYVIDTSPELFVRLWFSDWNLYSNSNASRITVYGGTEKRDNILASTQNSEYPMVVPLHEGPLIIVFQTGTQTRKALYLGFRAHVNITSDRRWPDRPTPYDCGGYYEISRGGSFDLNTNECPSGAMVECIWVIYKYRFGSDYEYVWLSISDVLLDPEDGDELEMRSGNNSLGPLLGTNAWLVGPGDEFYEKDAYYVRLRARCRRDRYFSAVYTSYVNAQRDVLTGAYRCIQPIHSMCNNKRCIFNLLWCDSRNNCGDNSDEHSCHGGVDPGHCGGSLHYPCDDGSGFYCSSTKCDHFPDCQDATDERYCAFSNTVSTSKPRVYNGSSNGHYYWGTITPVILICLIFVIIACVVISYYVRRKRLLRERRLAAEQRTRDHPPPPQRTPTQPENTTLLENGMPTVDGLLPPPYEEVVSARYVHSCGTVNFAYDNSCRDISLLPPPYTPKYENSATVPEEHPSHTYPIADSGSEPPQDHITSPHPHPRRSPRENPPPHTTPPQPHVQGTGLLPSSVQGTPPSYTETSTQGSWCPETRRERDGRPKGGDQLQRRRRGRPNDNDNHPVDQSHPPQSPSLVGHAALTMLPPSGIPENAPPQRQGGSPHTSGSTQPLSRSRGPDICPSTKTAAPHSPPKEINSTPMESQSAIQGAALATPIPRADDLAIPLPTVTIEEAGDVFV